MNRILETALAGAMSMTGGAGAAELHPLLQRLAKCEASWLDWAKDEAQMTKYAEAVESQFRYDEKKRVFLPLAPVQFLGFPVVELIPENMGIGLGFAVTVKAPLDTVRARFEEAIAKKFAHCEAQEGLTVCQVELAPKRTAMVVAATSRPDVGTQVGCFYYYER